MLESSNLEHANSLDNPRHGTLQADHLNPLLIELLRKLKEDSESAEWKLNLYRYSKAQRSIERYEQWVADRLPTSCLDTLIPRGMELLPDIYSRMPLLLRRFEELRRPRSLEQLLNHLYVYLYWYLDQSRPLRAPAWLRATLAAVVILPVLFAIIALVTGMPAEALAYSLTILFGIAALTYQPGLGDGSQQWIESAVNKIALKKYLWDAYSDPVTESAVKESEIYWEDRIIT